MCALHDVLKTGSHYLGSNFNGTSSDSNGASTKLRIVATSNESAICKGYCFALFQHDVWLCARYRKIIEGNALQAWMAWPSCHQHQRMQMVGRDCTSCSITRLPSVESTSPSQTVNKDRLGIPIMFDRALQALVKLALEPEWEAKFEANTYGFRPGRSAHDAIEAIFNLHLG